MDWRILILDTLDKHPALALLVGNLVVIIPGCFALIYELNRTCRTDLKLWLLVLVLRLVMRCATYLYSVHYETKLLYMEQGLESESHTPQTTSRRHPTSYRSELNSRNTSERDLLSEDSDVASIPIRESLVIGNASVSVHNDGEHSDSANGHIALVATTTSSSLSLSIISTHVSSHSTFHHPTSIEPSSNSTEVSSNTLQDNANAIQTTNNRLAVTVISSYRDRVRSGLHSTENAENTDNLDEEELQRHNDVVEPTILFLQKFLDILDVFGVVWFAVGNLLVFNNLACLQISPVVFLVCLSYLIYAYLSFILPALLQCSLNCWKPNESCSSDLRGDSNTSHHRRRALFSAPFYGFHGQDSNNSRINSNQSNHNNHQSPRIARSNSDRHNNIHNNIDRTNSPNRRSRLLLNRRPIDMLLSLGIDLHNQQSDSEDGSEDDYDDSSNDSEDNEDYDPSNLNMNINNRRTHSNYTNSIPDRDEGDNNMNHIHNQRYSHPYHHHYNHHHRFINNYYGRYNRSGHSNLSSSSKSVRRKAMRRFWRNWLRHFDCTEFLFDTQHPALSALLSAANAGNDNSDNQCSDVQKPHSAHQNSNNTTTAVYAPLSSSAEYVGHNTTPDLHCAICLTPLRPYVASRRSTHNSPHLNSDNDHCLAVTDLESGQTTPVSSVSNSNTGNTSMNISTINQDVLVEEGGDTSDIVEIEERLVCFPCANNQQLAGDLAHNNQSQTNVGDENDRVTSIEGNHDTNHTSPQQPTLFSATNIQQHVRHVFHSRCLHDWLQTLRKSGRSLRCPLCRSLPHLPISCIPAPSSHQHHQPFNSSDNYNNTNGIHNHHNQRNYDHV